jgi:hypothetical protein
VVFDQTEEIVALVLTFVVHVIGAGLLIWGMLDREEGSSGWRGWWPRDDDERPDGPDRDPAPGGDRLPLPLPGAEPSPVRLREPGRAGERYPRPARRPEHAPERTPERVP